MSEMTPELWQRVTAVLDRVLYQEQGKREALLSDLCSGNEDLRREVESLLDYEDDSVSLLEEPIVPRAKEHPAGTDEETAGDPANEAVEIGLRIGPYEVLKRLGTGGMGDVFLVERLDSFRQKVALKRIQTGKIAKDENLAKELRYRFETERQILADLEHTNIARILDGGTTEDGQPYFTMEYVEGEPIDRYCDRHRLPIRARLELFLRVCSALQLAHQNLVVHRDLKPGNILVTEKGVPKLLDFGIAKLLDPGVQAEAATRLGGQPMTLRYAAPEQLLSEAITTATDVYALGVLLYQLLTGHDPYPYDQGTLKLHRAICEELPPRPSDAVASSVVVRMRRDQRETRTPESVSGPRGANPESLKRDLAGDLDSIVLKTLHKGPKNRYRSMEQLAADIRRYLNGQPVSAREGTPSYRAGKFVRRNRLRLAAAGILLLIITASAVAMMTVWRRATEVRIEATKQTTRLLIDLFDAVDPNESGNRINPLEFLDRSRRQIAEELSGEPELLASLLNDPFAKLYGRLGHYEEALASLNQALAIMRTRQPGDHPTTAEVLLNKGAFLYRTGNYEGADQLYGEAIEMRERLKLGGIDLVVPLGNLATNRAREGRYEAAADLNRRALEIQRRLDPDHPRLTGLMRNLAMQDFIRGQHHSAEAVLRQALEIELAKYGPTSTQVASVRSALGRVLDAEGEFVKAEKQLGEALDVRRQLFDEGNIAIARAERSLAAVLLQTGELALATAEVLLASAQPPLRRTLPDDHWEIAELEGLVGAYLIEIGDFDLAENCLVDSYRAIEKARGSDAIYTKQALERLIRLYELWGKPQRANEYRLVLKARPK